MRSLLIFPLTAILLAGCLTTQENPNYEYSTTYRGDSPDQNQYAAAEQAPAPISGTQYNRTEYAGITGGNQYASSQYTSTIAPTASVSIDSPEAQAIFASTGATDPSLIRSSAIVAAPSIVASAPTDSQYSAGEVTGTPGFMALQQAQNAPTLQAAAPALPAAQTVNRAPIGISGTPIDYDYSRNIIAADAVTTNQQFPETVRTLQSTGQNYTVQQGDTVYSLARKTCVGVNVIQSMNGLNSDFAINIGQSIRLPQSVC